MKRIGLCLALCAGVTAGCAKAPIPAPGTLALTAGARDWPAFLPVDEVLPASMDGADAIAMHARAIEGRARRLRLKARLLRQPVTDAYDAIQGF